MNQTRITKSKGELAFSRLIGENLACTVNPSLSLSLSVTPAQAVKLVPQSSATADAPLIITPASPTDDILGFAIKGLRSDTYHAGDQLDVAIDGAIMMMEASGAINAGKRVGINTSVQIVDATTAHVAQIGILLDQAINSGDLVRVLIKTPHLDSLSYDS